MAIPNDSLQYEGNVPDHVLNFLCRELHHVPFAFSLRLTSHCNLNLIIRSLCLLQRILYKSQVCIETTYSFCLASTRESLVSAYQSCKQFCLSTSGEASRIGVMNNLWEIFTWISRTELFKFANYASVSVLVKIVNVNDARPRLLICVYSYFKIVSNVKICRIYYVWIFFIEHSIFFFIGLKISILYRIYKICICFLQSIKILQKKILISYHVCSQCNGQ